MPLDSIKQPERITIEDKIRLIKPNKEIWVKALPWYQNPLVLYNSEGVTGYVYGETQINNMYQYLSNIGELYFIEILDRDGWVSIGDVTLSSENMPIVLGDEKYWGRGIGKKVIGYLLERAKYIELKKITLNIYTYNKRSQNLFKSMGFKKIGQKENEILYELYL